MKKFLALISIVLFIVLTGCSAENNEITDNNILKETTEHTTLSAPVNQEGDLTESHEIKDIKNISDTIKISYFNEEISTNRFDEGDEYNILESTKIHLMVLYLSVYLMISYQVIQAIKCLMMNTIGINSVMLIQKRNAMFFSNNRL